MLYTFTVTFLTQPVTHLVTHVVLSKVITVVSLTSESVIAVAGELTVTEF